MARGQKAAPPPLTAAPSRTWRIGFAATLTAAMAVGTFGQFALGVLAPFITDEFALTRTSFGLLAMTLATVGAACSPLAGTLVDRWGARRCLVVLFVAGASALAVFGVSPSYLWLFVGAAVAGISMSAANPATNRLVARHLPAGRRGVLMGVKQSGVQIGALLAGVSLPVAAGAFGWRPVLVAAAALPLLGLVAALRFVPHDPIAERSEAHGIAVVLRGPLARLAAATFFVGAGWACVAAYLPLYAYEALDYPVAAAGLVGGVVGMAGVSGRIVWGWLAERRRSTLNMLVAVSAGAVVAATAILLAVVIAPVFVWIGAALVGLTAATWMALAMLAALDHSGLALAGRSSAAVALAFHAGFVPSPAVFGRIVDVTGSYRWAWGLVIAAFCCATVAALRLRARSSLELARADGSLGSHTIPPATG